MPRSGEQYKAVKAAALAPDEYENTEYGVKWDVSDELTITASVFEQEAETESSVAGEGFIQQLEVDGYELEINGKISNRTSVSLGYSDMDGEAGDGGTATKFQKQCIRCLLIIRRVNDLLMALASLIKTSQLSNKRQAWLNLSRSCQITRALMRRCPM